MKSFPNNERFWQYNWTLFSCVIQHQNDDSYLFFRAVNFPYRMGPTLVNFLSWRVPTTALLL